MPAPTSRAPFFQSGDLEVDFAKQEPRLHGVRLDLTPTQIPETGWIATAIVLYVLTAILGVTLYGPAIRRQLAEAERDPSSPDYAAAERRSNLLGVGTFLIVAVIVVLMVTKPF
jgi:uncharacterized membrane protein